MANAGIVAELFEKGDSFFGYEVWSRVSSFLERALNAGLNSEDRELWQAICNEDIKLLQALLDDGANPNSSVTLRCHGSKKYFAENNIARLPNEEEVDCWSVAYDANVSVLMYTAALSSPEVVSILVSSNADVNYVGVGRQTPLSFMLDLRHAFGKDEERKCFRIATTLINAGANINRVDDHGDTALILASGNGHAEIAKLLVEKGADVNWCGRGNTTALMNAADKQDSDLIRFLIDHGSNPEIRRERDGYTAFLIAAFIPSLNCINALIEKGANIFATDNQGWSALDILEYRDSCILVNDTVSADAWSFWNLDKTEVVDLLAKQGVRYKSTQYSYKNSSLVESCAPRPSNELSSREAKVHNPDNRTNSSTSNSNTAGCYVATAVYGSYDCPQVWTLRRFRDYRLSNTPCGRAFIRVYYAVSPTLVRWFGDMKWFRDFCRKKLDCMVAHLQTEGYESSPYQDGEF